MSVTTGVTPLFCLPHAGGSALAYRQWNARTPAHVSVRPVELPGRGGRMREPLADRVDRLVGLLADEIDQEIDRIGVPGGSYALFGHSFGSLLAFELARALRGRRGEPAALLVSGRNGPSLPSAGPSLHHRPEVELLRGLAAFGGLDDRVLEHPELREVFLPILRADLRLAETYRRTPAEPLACPLVVCYGTSDPLVTSAGAAAWGAETSGPVEIRRFDGGHFYFAGDRSFPNRFLDGTAFGGG